MKPDIHPKTYRKVVFKDMSCDFSFITQSCVDSKETIKWEDGNEYPLFKLEISSKSHPFYTGKQNLIDTAGRIDKFMKRYGNKKPAAPAAPAAPVAETAVEEAPVANTEE